MAYYEIIWLYNNDGRVRSQSKSFIEMTQCAMASFTKCSPARTAIFVQNEGADNEDASSWDPVAAMGILPGTLLLNQNELVLNINRYYYIIQSILI